MGTVRIAALDGKCRLRQPADPGTGTARPLFVGRNGFGGIDLYLACFGPALQVFTEAWPLTRGTARPQPNTSQRGLSEEFDPYVVRPEDALEAAGREVKQWRMEQLAAVKRQHHLDALTEW